MDSKKTEKLDYYAQKTLDGLSGWTYPALALEKTSRNVFMGSGDAANTAKILAQNFGGIGLTVVNFRSFFENNPEKNLNVYIVNASGGKDGVVMAEWLVGHGWQPKLITSNPEPPAGKFLKPDNIYVFPAIVEPPTYNVSTYAAMLYGILKEDIGGLKETLETLKIPNLRTYKYVFFLASDKYEIVAKMASRKVAETLSGVGANGGGFSNAAHGMLLQPNKDRLVFCLNTKYDGPGNTYELNIDSYLGLLLAVHYIVGKNQTDADTQNILRNYEENARKLGWTFNKVW